MPKYQEGDWVIDTKNRTAPTVACILPNQGMEQLYVLENEGEYYIACESNMEPYDKHFFDKE